MLSVIIPRTINVRAINGEKLTFRLTTITNKDIYFNFRFQSNGNAFKRCYKKVDRAQIFNISK